MHRLNLAPELSERDLYKKQVQEVCEAFWKEPLERSAIEKVQQRRTWNLIKKIPLKGKRVVDLGCGDGALAKLLFEKGADVVGVDASLSALQRCLSGIETVQACLPYHRLSEGGFDGVLLTEVLAEIKPSLHRLLLSEIAELMKPGGFFICSTEIDVHSYDAHVQFQALIQTEFEVLECIKSYHRLKHPKLEPLAQLVWGDWGLTHLILLCRRKSLLFGQSIP